MCCAEAPGDAPKVFLAAPTQESEADAREQCGRMSALRKGPKFSSWRI